MSNTETVRRLLAALENADVDAITELYAEDAVQVEFPNQLLPQGARRDRDGLLQACLRGKALMAAQSYRVTSMVEAGDVVALEADWEGRLAVDAPPLGLRKGDVMKAHFAQFLHFRGGRIMRHHTYDCFRDWKH